MEIGKWIDSASLGIYVKACNLLLYPIQQLSAPISGVAIPALSRVNNDPDRYRRVFIQFQSIIVLITMPALLFLLISADSIVFIVLGPQWMEAVSILRWLGLAGISQAILISSGWIFVTQNRTEEMLHLGIFSSILCVSSFIIGLPWGINGIAAFYGIISLLIRTPLSFWWLTRKGHIKPSLYMSTLVPGAKLSAILFVCCFSVNYFTSFNNPFIKISILSLAAIFSYSIAYFMFMDLKKTFTEIIIMKNTLFNRK
jgi:PST family polysaccharide transporter